jgi:hypothetical protein
MSTPQKEANIITAFKSYAAPFLFTALTALIYADVRELKNDVKKLMKYEIILEGLSSKSITRKAKKETLYFKPEDFYDAERFLKRDIPS